MQLLLVSYYPLSFSGSLIKLLSDPRMCYALFIPVPLSGPSVEFTFSKKAFFSFLLLSFFLAFQGHTWGIWKFPGQGLNRSYSWWPIPQQQQLRICDCQIHHSLRQRQIPDPLSRPGIEPASSWILARFISSPPQWELPLFFSSFFPFLAMPTACGSSWPGTNPSNSTAVMTLDP